MCELFSASGGSDQALTPCDVLYSAIRSKQFLPEANAFGLIPEGKTSLFAIAVRLIDQPDLVRLKLETVLGQASSLHRGAEGKCLSAVWEFNKPVAIKDQRWRQLREVVSCVGDISILSWRPDAENFEACIEATDARIDLDGWYYGRLLRQVELAKAYESLPRDGRRV